MLHKSFCEMASIIDLAFQLGYKNTKFELENWSIFCELHIVVQRSHFTSDGIIHLNYMVSNVIHSIGKCLTISDVVFFTINFELGEGFVKVQHHLTKLVLLTKFVKFKIVEDLY